MTKEFLKGAYGERTGAQSREFYDEWAASYDEELASNGYVTPRRLATALARFVTDRSSPILDLGCGTGLSGAALRAVGFSTIDGWDPSSEMLRRAERRNVYRVLRQIEPTARLMARKGAFAAVNAAGVLGPGVAPPEALDQVFDFLAPGGFISFSLNDYAIEDGSHKAHLDALVESGVCKVRFEEYGEHIPGNEMNCWIYVAEKI